jgi:hypothetical protein
MPWIHTKNIHKTVEKTSSSQQLPSLTGISDPGAPGLHQNTPASFKSHNNVISSHFQRYSGGISESSRKK